jgi:hypothetical protein
LTAQEIEILPRRLAGFLAVPKTAKGIVVFAHGSGSSRLSPRNMSVSRALNEAGFATLLFDLLVPKEAEDRSNVFDIALLASRVEESLEWIRRSEAIAHLAVGLFEARAQPLPCRRRRVGPTRCRLWYPAAAGRNLQPRH